MTPLNWTLQKRKTSLHVYMTVHTCLYLVLCCYNYIHVRLCDNIIPSCYIHGSQYLRVTLFMKCMVKVP